MSSETREDQATKRKRLFAVCFLFLVLFYIRPLAVVRADSDSSERRRDPRPDSLGVDSDSFADDAWMNPERFVGASDTEFRIDNTVCFVRNERETKYTTSTVFYGDLAFDFVGDNGEIVVYSFRARKFLLIDPLRRVRSAINESELDAFTERIKPILREKKGGFISFMTEPTFTISKKEDEYFFQSKWIDYHATTIPFDDEVIADLYFRYVEAIGKLNVYMNPGALTPLARIEANRTFMSDSRFPTKITTDLYPKGKTIFTKTFQIESNSTLARRLSERDRDRVNRAVHFFEQFQFVSFRTYFEKTGSR